MTAGGSKSLPSIGFLTVTEHPEHGLFGGYLVLNTAARPLEFHCTAPVRANRAQEILYGPTLKPFLYGEQIGHTLVSKARHRPLWICTDVVHVLDLRSTIDIPVIQLLTGTTPDTALANSAAATPTPAGPSPAGPSPVARSAARDAAAGVNSSAGPERAANLSRRIDPAHEMVAGGPAVPFQLGAFEVAVGAAYAEDQRRVHDAWSQHAAGLDLGEPFERIRGAIEEAQRAAR